MYFFPLTVAKVYLFLQIDIHRHRLQLWPGYLTSIRQHETHIMMCAEITHKVMRLDTMLDLLVQVRDQAGRNFQEEFKNRALGLVVLTDYNNRTYRIDDVNFKLTPRNTFPKKNGTEITYMAYYFEVCSIRQKHSVSQCHLTLKSGEPTLVGCILPSFYYY